jgi:hypothetical protein
MAAEPDAARRVLLLCRGGGASGFWRPVLPGLGRTATPRGTALSRVAVASARSGIVKALHGMRDWLLRQGAEILIVFVLALLGGACGWLLRDQLVKRSDEMQRETSHLHARAGELLLATAETDRMAGDVDRHVGTSMRS